MGVELDLIVHDIQRASDWPDNVSEVCQLMFRPCPKSLIADEVRDELSTCALEMYDELLRSPLLVVEDTSERTDRRLMDILDLLLSSVHLTKSTISLPNGEIQMRSSWTSIIALLGIALQEDVYVIEETPFLIPRTKTNPTIKSFRDLEGKAEILLSALLPRSLREGGSEVEVDESNVGYIGADAGVSENSFVTLDVPLDGHVIPGRGKRVDCLFPVVCAAKEDSVEALVTSVVCQRYVWKMSSPVVGISLSSCSTIARVVIGWSEEPMWSDDEDARPTIHLAYARGNDVIDPRLGLFNILDPASVLHFSQFIFGLHSQFSSIQHHSRLMDTRNFCWRMDHTDYDHPLEGEVSSGSKSRLEGWIDGLSKAEKPEHHDILLTDCPVSAMPPPPPASSNAKPPGSSLSSSNSKKGSSVLVSESSKPTTPRLLPSEPPPKIVKTNPSDDDMRSKASATNLSTKSKSQKSASEFAALEPNEMFAPGIDTWLWDRLTIRLHRIKLHQTEGLRGQIDSMIDIYNDVTQLCWPKAWKTAAQIPQSGEFSKELGVQLFQHYQRYKAEKTIGEMPEDIASSIITRMSALYQTIAEALRGQAYIEIHDAPEAAMRSAWDNIIRATWCPYNSISTTFIVEKTIPLPKNLAVDPSIGYDGEAQARLQHFLATLQAAEAPGAKVPENVLQTAFLAAERAQAMFTRFDKDTTYAPTPADRPLEPTSARVDAMCCFEFALEELPQSSTDRKWNPQPVHWMKSFFKKQRYSKLFGKPCSEYKAGHERRRKERAQEVNTPSDGNEMVQNREALKQPAKQPQESHVGHLLCPSVTERLPAYPPVKLPRSQAAFPKLYIPFLFAEYKKSSTTFRQALHQMFLYCSYGVKNLSALGITDEPVWGIVVGGSEGIIIMAWMSTVQVGREEMEQKNVNYTFVIDHYARSFDLTQPLQVFQLMSSIARIHKRHTALYQKLKEKLDPSIFQNPTDELKEMMMIKTKDNNGTTAEEKQD